MIVHFCDIIQIVTDRTAKKGDVWKQMKPKKKTKLLLDDEPSTFFDGICSVRYFVAVRAPSNYSDCVAPQAQKTFHSPKSNFNAFQRPGEKAIFICAPCRNWLKVPLILIGV